MDKTHTGQPYVPPKESAVSRIGWALVAAPAGLGLAWVSIYGFMTGGDKTTAPVAHYLFMTSMMILGCSFLLSAVAEFPWPKRSRESTDRLRTIAGIGCLQFFATLLLLGLFTTSFYLPGLATLRVLTVLWLAGMPPLAFDGFRVKDRKESTGEVLFVILAWPALLVMKMPGLTVPFLLIYGGEWVGYRYGHPNWGACGALGIIIAAMVLMISWRSKSMKKHGLHSLRAK